MSQEVFKTIGEKFPFLKDAQALEESFLTWIGIRLVPRSFENGYLYQETEKFSGLLFIQEGTVSFVLPRFKNAVYGEKSEGDIIGLEDYAYDLATNSVHYENVDEMH